MKLAPPSGRNGIFTFRLAFSLAAAALIPLLVYGSAPAWWSQRGVLVETAATEDYALANQGQLKNIAKSAVAELDAKIPGGAGDVLHSLIASWSSPSSQTNDFAPVNLGQLKNVAKPFYDRLMSVKYAATYPWTARGAVPDDLGMVNIGQIKNLFSFDLRATDAVHDADANGLPDWWERYYFGNVGVDPNAAAPRGDGLTNLEAFLQQLDPINDCRIVAINPERIDETVPTGQIVTRTISVTDTTNAARQLTFSPHAATATVNYSYTDSDQEGGPAFVWNDISSTGAHMDSVSDADTGFESFPLSFSFPYYGNSYTTVYVASDGFLTFGTGSDYWWGGAMPDSRSPAAMIAAFEDDLDLGASGDIYYQDYGDHVVIQFENAVRYYGDGYVTFQIVLRRDGTILFYYKDMEGTVDEAVVGIQNLATNQGLTIAYYQLYLKSNFAVQITRTTAWEPAPWLQVSPVTVSLPPGASADLSITLDGRTLTSGVFSGGVTVSTDDPSFAPREIPVTMTLVDESQLDNDHDDLTNGQERALGTDPNKIDTDGDGMPDGWEVTHGLNPLVNDASEDLDGDGSTNLQEYKDKTGPLVFAAPARVVDTFDNWNYVVAQSGDWQLDATNPGDFDGDTSRAVRVSATTGSLTYWMPALVSVDVTVYYRGTLAADQIRLYSSPDNATWTEVTASEVVGWEAGVGWRGGVFRQSQGFSTDTRYLRIDVSGADPPWTPQLSQIVFVHTDLNRPVADSGNVTVSAGASATITLSGRDADANPVTYRVIQQPSHGALSGAPPNLSYTATTDYIGQDRFSFVANDGVRDSAPANIYITVQPPALAAPTNLAFTETSNSSAQLSWMAEADGSGFTVERSTDGGLTWQQIGEVSGATTSFTDSAYASGKFYSYRVRAKGQTGSISEPSDQISSRGTDPTIADSDGDGVVDNREAQLHSNPDSKDTDGDDVPDSEDGAPLDPTRWAKPIQRQYAVIDLGALPGSPGSWPLAINNHGHVLCAADPYGRYFLWQNGRRTELPGTFTPYGLNDSDMVVGDTTYFFPPYSQMELTGAYWNNGQVIRLAQLTVGYPGYPQYQTYTSSARAINNAGEIVGWSSPDGSSLFATKWAGGGGTVIPAPNSNKVRPFAISDSGAVLGTVETNSGYDIDLFPATRLGAERYQDGGIEGYRINSAGVIVNRQRQIWPGGVGVASQNINALLAPESATTIDDVTTITNANEILADAHDGTGDAYLVVLHLASANSPAQLYKVVESDQRISWMIPIDMNDKGLIAATAFFNDGTEHAVELVPVEFVEVTPALRDDDGAEIPNSTKPKSFLQSNDLVEEPRTGQIPNVAYRVLKVKASKEIMAGEKVKWSMMPQVTPGGTNQPTFRGQWPEQHADRFEAAPGNADGFERLSQAEGRTTLDAEGFFAARINLPPIGFNKARLKLEFEKYPGAYSEIDFEVPAVVVIDPGHGGTTDFPDSSSNNAISASGNTKEKDMTLSYGTALMDALRAKAQQDDLNLKLFLTRKTDDNIEGHLRAKVARDHGADIFLSIHFNAFNKTARGVETWVRFPGDNVNQAEDTSLATRIVDSVYSAIRDFDGATNNRGVKPDPTNASELQRSHLAVLSDTNYANTAAFHSIRGTLCEIEFIDVPAVDVLLNTGTDAVAVKQAIIYAMRDGILYDLKHQPAAP